MKSKPRRPVKGLALLLVLLMGVLAPGCMVSTGVHLWQFRNQMIDFDRNCRFVDARGERGPELQFLDPVLTREDIRSVANGRPATRIDKVGLEERWVFIWDRHPDTIKKPINLELRFRNDRLVAISLDARFSQVLGDRRIEMLARSFTSRITDLDLKRKEIRCVLPADSLARFTPLTTTHLDRCFGRSNYSRLSEIPGTRRHVYRYLLKGVQTDKAKMAFSGFLDRNRDRAMAVSVKIGSYSLVLDFTEQRRIRPAGTGKPPQKQVK